MARKRPKRPAVPKFLGPLWSGVATVAALWLGYLQYTDASASKRLDAREKLDAFMVEVRQDYDAHCLQQSESLKPIFAGRYDDLVALADVDAALPPYDKPCFLAEAPGAPSGLSVRVTAGTGAAHYDDWLAFESTDKKVAVIWIDDIPISMNLQGSDWPAFKEFHEEAQKQAQDCTQGLRAKAENTFVQLECLWGLDENNAVQLFTVQSQ